MAPRSKDSELETRLPAAGDGTLEPGPVLRRAPFSDNPNVGARGQRTQQRILDAALQVFADDGYHQSGIARITELAGCSRASFYQYFASKEDVFRQLTGQVARQLAASAEALEPLTPDADGWASLRAWVARYSDIYDRYEPVFHVFDAAARTDEALAVGSVRTTTRNVERIRSRLVTTSLPPRQLDPVIRVLLAAVTRSLAVAATLRSVEPKVYRRDRVEDAIADVLHRALFELRPDVNVHPPMRRRPPRIPWGPMTREVLRDDDDVSEMTAAGRRTLEALMEAGHDAFVRRGYHGTRVDDVVDAAGVSHGAFYRYFENKDHLARVLNVRAMRTVATVLLEIPDSSEPGAASRPALRRWLRRYVETQSTEAAMFQVMLDASGSDARLQSDSAAALDWGRRRLARFLTPRGFGDVDTEALVMVALLSSLLAHEPSAAIVDAGVHVIDHGFLGR